MHPALRFFALAAFTVGAGAPEDPFMGPGVSKELATSRSRDLSDVRYQMALSVVSRDSARGSITVKFSAKRAADVILDFRGPSLTNVRVNGTNAATSFNGAHLRVPASSIHAGENVVTANFRSMIAPAGASIIRFHDDKDGN